MYIETEILMLTTHFLFLFFVLLFFFVPFCVLFFIEENHKIFYDVPFYLMSTFFILLKNLKNLFRIEERKEMENLFKKSQKPYVKHLKKVEKKKHNYHKACDNAKIVMQQVRYAINECDRITPMQVNKKHIFIYETIVCQRNISKLLSDECVFSIDISMFFFFFFSLIGETIATLHGRSRSQNFLLP